MVFSCRMSVMCAFQGLLSARAADAPDLSMLGAFNTWDNPGRITRCPVHEPATVATEDGAVQITFEGKAGKMFGMVETLIDVLGNDFKLYDGLELKYTATGLLHFKMRLGDDQESVRFISNVSNSSAAGNQTLWIPWSDFHGEKMVRAGINPCLHTEECHDIHVPSISSIALIFPVVQSQNTTFLMHSLMAKTQHAPVVEGAVVENHTHGVAQPNDHHGHDHAEDKPIVFAFTKETELSSFAQNFQHGWLSRIILAVAFLAPVM